ncbi:MAG: tetratricopeptide (TPR) repeat protein [Flavobacteriales bacterium]|jgi:tetratricopeptide (TPR) repeat protein
MLLQCKQYTISVVLLASVLLAALAQPALARKKPQTSVADLRYGVTLYNYYNDDYIGALTELLIAEERGGIKGHGDNPEIMKGGLALGYSMEHYASEIFERLLEENRSSEVQDSAWFFLAKLRYRNGDWLRSQEAVDRVSDKPRREIREDVNALRVNLLVKQDRLVDAEALLKRYDFSESWTPFINFNLGSAYARRRDYIRAIEYFDHFIKQPYRLEQHRALYDKAMTAAGYAYLFLKEYDKAMEQFSRVRMTSKLSNRALLGYGWAAAETEDYEAALKPWVHLTKSSLIDENSQEAMIAVPYAYEKLGSEGLALQYYQSAETSFIGELERLDVVINDLRSEQLTEALNVDVEQGMDWLSFARENELSPRLTYLVSLFSKQKFQGSVEQLRELLALRDNLIEWRKKLSFYTNMIDNREENRLAKAEYLEVAELGQRVEGMKQLRSNLAAKIERIAAEKDYLALSTGPEADLAKRALRIRKNIELLRESDPFIDEYEESSRRFYGLILWEASDAFADRMWTAIKDLNKLDLEIKKLNATRIRVQKIMENAPDLDPYKVKMEAAQATVDYHLVDIDRMIGRSERGLRNQVITTLGRQRVKLQNFLAQTRLAIARIYDKANQDRILEEQKALQQAREEKERVRQIEAAANEEKTSDSDTDAETSAETEDTPSASSGDGLDEPEASGAPETQNSGESK